MRKHIIVPLSQDELKKILVINLGGMGDFLLSIPALKALRNFYRTSWIVLLTVPRTKKITDGFSYFDEVLPFDSGWFKLYKVISELRKRKFDMAINMRTLVSWKSACKMALLFHGIGARYKVGRDTAKRGFFLDVKVPEDERGSMPEYEYDLNTVRALGVQAEFCLPEITVRPEDTTSINKFFAEHNISEKDMVIGINPFAPWPAKCWPLENFAEIIKALKKEFDCKIVITGSGNEREAALQLKELSGIEIAIASGRTSLEELAVLLKRCSVYITNDTGPMHLAAIVHIPLVAIFGGGYLKRFDPRNISDKAIVLCKGVDCSPCNKIHCSSMKCLKEISPEEVVLAVRQLFSGEA